MGARSMGKTEKESWGRKKGERVEYDLCRGKKCFAFNWIFMKFSFCIALERLFSFHNAQKFIVA